MAEELTFNNLVTWTGGAMGEITFPSASGTNIEVALPAEFGGVGGYPSPEDLFVAAANACVLTTTLARARKYDVVLRSYRSRAKGVLETSADGREVTRIEVKVSLAADGDPETLMEMFADVAGRVPVIRSMSTSVSIDFELVEE
ncbi:MAG TPA: OsmC family protein [Methanothrix sp.]|nr:OsmC family protein [Methanothrix sp.]HRW83675.1 OsmC family protein [Methanothrix sp.]